MKTSLHSNSLPSSPHTPLLCLCTHYHCSVIVLSPFHYLSRPLSIPSHPHTAVDVQLGSQMNDKEHIIMIYELMPLFYELHTLPASVTMYVQCTRSTAADNPTDPEGSVCSNTNFLHQGKSRNGT